MNKLVVDASLVAAAFFGEQFAAGARRLLASRIELFAPEFIAVELANVVWKRHARKEIDADEALSLVADMDRLPLIKTPNAELIDPALRLALQAERSVYDCLYLALAVEKAAVMVTADRRLVNALARSPLKNQIAWLGSADLTGEA
jgi:predicted nucleic acid-binding protein